MRSDALRPLPPSFPLFDFVALAPDGSRHLLGGWVRGAARPLRFRSRRSTSVLVSGDLRQLLAACDLVAVRNGERVLLIRGRPLESRLALEIAAADTRAWPHRRGGRLSPATDPGAGDMIIPVAGSSAEAVLADCLREGLAVRGSRVIRLD